MSSACATQLASLNPISPAYGPAAGSFSVLHPRSKFREAGEVLDLAAGAPPQIDHVPRQRRQLGSGLVGGRDDETEAEKLGQETDGEIHDNKC